MNAVSALPVVVAANFTAEPIRDVLAHWLGLLAVDPPLAFAPYDQVLQQLLDPASLTSLTRAAVIARSSQTAAPCRARPSGGSSGRCCGDGAR